MDERTEVVGVDCDRTGLVIFWAGIVIGIIVGVIR